MQKEWTARARARMKERGITQEQLTSVLGVRSKGAVSHYLSGRRSLSIDQAASLARHLQCSLDWLVLGRPESVSVGRASPVGAVMDESGIAITTAKLQQLPRPAYRAISALVDQLLAAISR